MAQSSGSPTRVFSKIPIAGGEFERTVSHVPGICEENFTYSEGTLLSRIQEPDKVGTTHAAMTTYAAQEKLINNQKMRPGLTGAMRESEANFSVLNSPANGKRSGIFHTL